MLITHKPKTLPVADFQALGLNDLAYTRAVTTDEGMKGFAIHAADGTLMAVCETLDLAFAVIRQHDMEPAQVH